MDYMLPSRNNDTLLINSGTLTGHENINSRQEDPSMFLQFPSPFVDDMDTATIIPNLRHHQHYSDDCRTTTISTLDNPLKIMKTTTETLPSKLKCVRKRRIAGKKDRHSKIYTAQGLRDRRMRLSVHTARKFFDLNDMLGFDKASKTIEWLFSKSKKAIEEVAGGLQADDTTIPFRRENIESQSPLSAGEIEPALKIVKVAAEKDANLELQSDQIEDESSQKPKESYPLIKKSRSKVRERARDRTRERIIIKHLEKPRRLFEADASADFDQPQLGFEGNSDNHIMEESSCLPVDYSNIYHFVKHLHLDNTIGNNDSYVGNVTTISSTNCSTLDYNKTIAEPPAGWLNSKNTFLGFIGGWDSEYSRMESGNGIVQNFGPFTDSINGENPSSGIISTSNFMNFHSQNQG